MGKSGVDVSTFKAHSLRAASVSKAKAGFVPITNILNTAGWSSAGTFAKYYDNKLLIKHKIKHMSYFQMQVIIIIV